MAAVPSKLKSQGRISIGLEQGSSSERAADDFKDIHLAHFADKAPTPKSDAELKEGIRKAVRKRYARG